MKIIMAILILFIVSIKISKGQDSKTINITLVKDAVIKGAVCLDGSPGAYFYDPGFGEAARNWIIFLEGGGWCYDKYDCIKRSKDLIKNSGSTKNLTVHYFRAMLSPFQQFNPDFYNWSRVYVPYCDGASFMADVDVVDPKINLFLRGARIFRAILEELQTKGLLNATKAILMGESAGGLAAMLNCDRFQAFVPNASTVKCIADSGFFLHTTSQERGFTKVNAFHELAHALPKACTSRLMNPSLCLFPENFIRDIQTPLFVLNSAFDWNQIQGLDTPPGENEDAWKNCRTNLSNCTPSLLQNIKDFRTTFLKTLTGVVDSPSRGFFINSCYTHNFIHITKNWLEIPTIENKTIEKVIGDWFYDRSNVRLIDEQDDSPLNCTVSD